MTNEKKVYTLSEFCKILRESQEFKAKMGEKVESEDKKNNGKAVKDILKQAKEFDGGLTDTKRKENPRDAKDLNKTTLDVDFATEPSDSYKERVKAQVLGFPSAENMKNTEIKDNESLDFEGNERFYNDRKEQAEEIATNKEKVKSSGLQGSKLAQEYKDIFKSNTMFENKEGKSEEKNNRPMKRLNFSKTVFINEAHMINKIPDDMKVDGNRFYMKDSVGNEYLIECVSDKVVKDYVHTNVVGYENKQKLDESFKRMKELYGYKSSDTNKASSIDENKNVGKMISESKEKLISKDTNKRNLMNVIVESGK